MRILELASGAMVPPGGIGESGVGEDEGAGDGDSMVPVVGDGGI